MRKPPRFQLTVQKLMLYSAILAIVWWGSQTLYRADRYRMKAEAYHEMAMIWKLPGQDPSHLCVRRWSELADRYRRAMWFSWLSADDDDRSAALPAPPHPMRTKGL
jgi:hypothetical protein